MNRTRQDSGRMIGAVVLIGIGVLFLLDQFFNFDFFGAMWPFFVILPGAAFIAFAVAGDKNSVNLIYPGLIVTGTGLILLIQNITGVWESWAYVWSLYPGMVGLGMIFAGQRTDSERTIQAGRGLITWSLVGFAVLFVFFQIILFGGLGSGLGRYFLPALLIGLGAWMLFKRGSAGDKRKIGE